jgi:DNA topoisomerase-1
VKSKRGQESFSASIPEVEAPADMTSDHVEKLIDQKIKGADSLGTDPTTGKKIYVLNGRYGPYVQLGESDDEKLKRGSLPPGVDPASVDFKMALEILSMPKTLGQHPGTKKDVKVGIGRFGPFVLHEGDYRSIPKTETVFTMTLQKALDLLAQPKKGRGKASALKEFGNHPIHEVPVSLFNGPYGPYIKAGKTNIGLPEGMTAEQLTKEKAIELVTEKLGTTAEKKTAPKKKSSAKSPVKKAAAKKTEEPTTKPAVPVKKVVVKKAPGNR